MLESGRHQMENCWKVFVETALQVLYRAPKLPGYPQEKIES